MSLHAAFCAGEPICRGWRAKNRLPSQKWMVIMGGTVVAQPSSYAYLRLGGKGMRNRFLLGAGLALAVALGWGDAQAQMLTMPAGPGAWYFGGEGGWTSLENESGKAGAITVKQSFRDGFNIGVRA